MHQTFYIMTKCDNLGILLQVEDENMLIDHDDMKLSKICMSS